MHVKEELRSLPDHLAAFVKWSVLGCAVGLVVGAAGVGFHTGIELATRLREQYPWLLWLLPLGGLVIVLLYHLGGMHPDPGTNFVLVAVRDNHPMPLRMAPLIVLSTVLTHLLGGSAGREGAALQLGGAMASWFGHKARLDGASVRILVVCGMSAAFSAMFGTPLTAAVFAMEVVHVGIMYYCALVPAIVSALVGLQTALWLGVEPTRFGVFGIPAFSPSVLLRVGALGVLISLLSLALCQALRLAAVWYGKYLPNDYLRVAAGGALVVGLTLLLGTTDYNGAGMEIIHAAVAGTARPEAFALKILFTALTLGAGYKGGEVVPVLFVGATFGCVAGPLLGLPASFAAALGMTALFCGVTNCPIASLLLSYELFGGAGLAYYALCCAASYMLSGYGGLYTAQQIVHSKLRPEPLEQDCVQTSTVGKGGGVP